MFLQINKALVFGVLADSNFTASYPGMTSPSPPLAHRSRHRSRHRFRSCRRRSPPALAPRAVLGYDMPRRSLSMSRPLVRLWNGVAWHCFEMDYNVRGTDKEASGNNRERRTVQTQKSESKNQDRKKSISKKSFSKNLFFGVFGEIDIFDPRFIFEKNLDFH